MTHAPALADAAPARAIKSTALVPDATYAAPAAPQSNGSVRQTRQHIDMRHFDEIQEEMFGFSKAQMVEELANKSVCRTSKSGRNSSNLCYTSRK